MPAQKHSPKVQSSKYFRHFLIAFCSFSLVTLLVNQFTDLNPKWVAPDVRTSQNGQLNLNLTAAKQNVRIGNQTMDSNVYNGGYIGPTWDIRGGDTVKIALDNNTDQPTNLHFHGSHVSPKGNSDNVLLNIRPGEDFQYEYNVPADHPPGFYWYHPHLHGYTDVQVGGGMVGAVIVRGDIDELPGIKGVPERILVLTTQDKGNTVGRLVNNQVNPTMYIRPFETLRLRIVNASNDDFYNLRIPGQPLHIISRDGNTLSELDSVTTELLAPGDRIEILFKAGMSGEYTVQSALYNQGFFTYVQDDFMKIKVFGLPVIPKELPKQLIPYDTFRDAEIAKVRTLTFSEGGTNDNPTFLLDGKQFDPKVIDQVMTLGTTEEWRLVNNSGETHPFHIHVNPFQVMSINGKPIERNSLDDTYPIPANSEVVIRTKYRDFDGKYVLHCHILFHEDHGMMQVVEVIKPGSDTAPHNGLPDRESMPEMNHGTMDMTKGRPRQNTTPIPVDHDTMQNTYMP